MYVAAVRAAGRRSAQLLARRSSAGAGAGAVQRRGMAGHGPLHISKGHTTVARIYMTTLFTWMGFRAYVDGPAVLVSALAQLKTGCVCVLLRAAIPCVCYLTAAAVSVLFHIVIVHVVLLYRSCPFASPDEKALHSVKHTWLSNVEHTAAS